MNHAFLIMAHDSPELLQRIINNIQAPNHYVFVHLDKKSKDRMVNIKWGKYLSNRIEVSWCGFSTTQAELLLLKEAFSHPVHFDYFHLISGHDYPCVSNSVFDSFFDSAIQGRSYMHFDSDEEHEQWIDKIRGRINGWHYNDCKKDTMIQRFVLKLKRKLYPMFSKRIYKGELYAGWNWFSWHFSLVEWLLNYCDKNPKYLNRFRYTACAEEVIFHTLLHPYINSLNIEKNDSLRYVDWHPNRPAESLPLILDERDYEEIINSHSLFCRKVFLGKSSILLDLLDAYIYQTKDDDVSYNLN